MTSPLELQQFFQSECKRGNSLFPSNARHNVQEKRCVSSEKRKDRWLNIPLRDQQQGTSDLILFRNIQTKDILMKNVDLFKIKLA